MPELDIYRLVEVELLKLGKSLESLTGLIDIWRLVGYGLLLLVFFDIVEIFVPPNFMNPVWEFQTMGSLVERVAVPLLSLLLIFSGKLEKRAKWERPLLAFFSWLTLLVGLLYILLIPLGVTNTVRLYNTNLEQFKREYSQQVSQANQVEKQLNETTPTQLENLLKRQGRSLDGRDPQELKTQLLAQLGQAKQQIKTQGEARKSSGNLRLLKSSVKWNLGALVSAALFITIWKRTRWARTRS
ncbi:HpsJ-like protein, cyanoexosortase A-associated [Cylindrospermum sp. FACHB-282]|uniref:HpsJ-like protein, cyanoexosortase A-associated n=1 Tax=Cylindrospermum sp. FACHB-282 TaxID=2692794 RepID=UPI001687A57E|nr:HpsJ family protein [Cylindrospermum sp. FACHB-282]MBD2388528.1 hypothetical protein [Cylindrospermum sp. FACHB-282]